LKVVAEFVTSADGPAGFPREGLPELAMVGRSNVGKSTLINALLKQPLARTSAAPGKTRLANYFRVRAEGLPVFFLVDLPGFGYARGGEAAQREFGRLADGYFGRTAPDGGSPVAGAFQLVDSRHPGLDSDRHAWAWLGTLGVARYAVATKLDKLTQAERRRHLKELERVHEGPVLPVSAATGEGLDELWTTIARLLRQPPPKDRPPSRPSPSTSPR
jgi:GTP-binding protein